MDPPRQHAIKEKRAQPSKDYARGMRESREAKNPHDKKRISQNDSRKQHIL